ncbi:MAG: hypothetical protein C0508_00180 [Cyanobacteria bacterium PR.023]|nr:hypothetical protein [Cyanobacteria bacterium PR.023]
MCSKPDAGEKLLLAGFIFVFSSGAAFAKSLETVNTFQSSKFQHAVSAYNSRRYKDAVVILEQLVNSKQATALAWLYLAHARYAIGNRNAAIFAYQVLKKSFPGTKEAEQAVICLRKFESESSLQSGQVAAPLAQQATSDELPEKVEIIPSKFGHTPVTTANSKAIKDAIINLPPKVRKILRDNGVGFCIAPTMEEQFPVFLRKEREGFPGYSNGTVGGLFDISINKVCVFQSKFDETSHQPLEVRSSDDLVGTLLHEAGHAIDAYLGDYSQSAEYKTAFYRDIDQMPENMSLKIKSFAQKTAFSQKESCAELTSVLLGGTRPNADELKAYLSNTVKVVKLHLGL